MRVGAAIKRIPIARSMRGYSAAAFRDDVLAGIVMATLTIPLSMGYAAVAGLPPVYGLFTAMISASIFALLTGSRQVMFGMDSATAAVTGSAVANMGLAMGSQEAAAAMPFLGLTVAIFTAAFFLLHLGRYAEKIPSPVMHGFMLGIACVVALGQLPKLLGVASAGATTIDKLASLVEQAGAIDVPTVLLAAGCIAVIFVLDRVAPKVPSAMVVLVAGTLAAACMGMLGCAPDTIGDIGGDMPVPMAPVIPQAGFLGTLNLLVDAFVVALVLSIESLLCLRAFASGRLAAHGALGDTGARMNRELGAAAIANGIAALFACPPSAASMSRTAAVRQANGKTQVTALVGAATVLLAVLFLGPVLALVPQAVLAAIVLCAIVKLPNYMKISRYFQHMQVEFAIVLGVAAMVFVFGAVYGVLLGLVATVTSNMLRRRGLNSHKAVFGFVALPEGKSRSALRKKLTAEEREQAASYVKMTFGTRLVFSNASDKTARAQEILAGIPVDVPLVMGLSRLRMVDASANDEILDLIASERARGRKVYCIRKLALANDSYTRYELRRVFARCDGVFASKKEYQIEAMKHVLACRRGAQASELGRLHASASGTMPFQLPDERPTVTLFIAAEGEDIVKGRLVFIKSRETIRFSATVEETDDGVRVVGIQMVRRRGHEKLGTFEDGAWSDSALNEVELARIREIVDTAVTYPAFLEEFDGIEIEEPSGNEFEL